MLVTSLPQDVSTGPIVNNESIRTQFDSEAIAEPTSAHSYLAPVAAPPGWMRGRASKTRALMHITISKDETDALFQM